MKQLVEYITGMDTRIGYPNEHLAGDSDAEVASPLYATAVGLLMNAISNENKGLDGEMEPELLEAEPVLAGHDEERTAKTAVKRERKSVFDKWSEKLKDFLDNAE